MELSKYFICQYLLHCYVLLFKSELDMKKKKKQILIGMQPLTSQPNNLH